MTNTLTKGATTITPDLVRPYSYERPAKTIVHVIPGSSADSYTLAPAGKRQGTLQMFFVTAAAAHAAENALATAGVWAYADTYDAAMDMNLVVVGSIAPAQQDSVTTWSLSLQFKEV